MAGVDVATSMLALGDLHLEFLYGAVEPDTCAAESKRINVADAVASELFVVSSPETCAAESKPVSGNVSMTVDSEHVGPLSPEACTTGSEQTSPREN